MLLQIRPMDMGDLDLAATMALEAHQLEKRSCSALSEKAPAAYIRRRLHAIIENGIGRVAIEAGIPVGFLAFEKAFPTGSSTYGAVSPLFGYGIRHEKRDIVLGRLFQDIAAALCAQHTQLLRVNVYAHDASVLWMYIMTAFAMDQTEAVRDTSAPLQQQPAPGIRYRELSKGELLHYKPAIIALYHDLINHLRVSPVFYHCRNFLPVDNRFHDFLSPDLRLFAAFDGERLVGMIDSEPVDIPLYKDDPEALCMGDVFVEPAYRGRGVSAGLLSFANDVLRKEGVQRLLVTHGTINPHARGFWDKHFTNYSYTLTRQIDVSMLGRIDRI